MIFLPLSEGNLCASIAVIGSNFGAHVPLVPIPVGGFCWNLCSTGLGFFNPFEVRLRFLLEKVSWNGPQCVNLVVLAFDLLTEQLMY